jgi:hypothetical protein
MIDIDDAVARICAADVETLKGMSMNRVADWYRAGGDLRTLIPLLTHSNSQVVECGAWIASEVVDRHRGREVFYELTALLNHPSAAVRFWAIESIALSISPNDHSAVERLFSLAVDSDAAVRAQALYWLCWIPDDVVTSLRGTGIWSSARLLLSGVGKDEVRAAIASAKFLDKRMAAAALARNFANDECFIAELSPLFDDEVNTAFPRLPRNRSFPS